MLTIYEIYFYEEIWYCNLLSSKIRKNTNNLDKENSATARIQRKQRKEIELMFLACLRFTRGIKPLQTKLHPFHCYFISMQSVSGLIQSSKREPDTTTNFSNRVSLTKSCSRDAFASVHVRIVSLQTWNYPIHHTRDIKITWPWRIRIKFLYRNPSSWFVWSFRFEFRVHLPSQFHQWNLWIDIHDPLLLITRYRHIRENSHLSRDFTWKLHF